MTKFLITIVLLPILAFAAWETVIYVVNETRCVKNGHDISCRLADPFNN